MRLKIAVSAVRPRLRAPFFTVIAVQSPSKRPETRAFAGFSLPSEAVIAGQDWRAHSGALWGHGFSALGASSANRPAVQVPAGRRQDEALRRAWPLSRDPQVGRALLAVEVSDPREGKATDVRSISGRVAEEGANREGAGRSAAPDGRGSVDRPRRAGRTGGSAERAHLQVGRYDVARQPIEAVQPEACEARPADFGERRLSRDRQATDRADHVAADRGAAADDRIARLGGRGASPRIRS